jgi:CBS domain-containing protein
MSTNLVTLSCHNSTLEIAKKMKSCKVGAIFLTNRGEVSADSSWRDRTNVVGIVTQTDLISEVCATNTIASEIISENIMSPVISICEDANIEEAAKLMTEKGVRHLGVHQKEKPDTILGILTGTDLAKYLKSKLIDQNQQGIMNIGEELALMDALSISDQLPSGNQDVEC